MLKSTLRKQSLKRREVLSDEEFLVLNQLLLAQFKTLDFSGINAIHIFLPIIEKREPDTYLLIHWLQENHPQIHVVVPKANFVDHSMSHHLYQKDDLQLSAYQIPEPQTSTPYNGEIDLVLVPLLAFDLRGYRVGYGKGFYDRFLSQIDAQRIGVSLFEAETEDISDVHQNDITLDLCITPHGIIKFEN
jgi:5-formyltetrahydrofolate cyclo-ligase